MSIEQHLNDRDIEITEDGTQPIGQRTQRHFKRVIAAVRAAEADYMDQLNESNERCREAQSHVIELQEKVRLLENELRRYKLTQKLSEIPALSTTDRSRLIEETA